eukprot:scaffold1416_cov117-Isochrysis_galbana.AAC.1
MWPGGLAPAQGDGSEAKAHRSSGELVPVLHKVEPQLEPDHQAIQCPDREPALACARLVAVAERRARAKRSRGGARGNEILMALGVRTGIVRDWGTGIGGAPDPVMRGRARE